MTAPRQKHLKSRIIAAASALGVCTVLMFSSASPAAAYSTGYQAFCSGVVLGNGASCYAYNYGLSGYPTEVAGSGQQHSVCVGAQSSDGINMCSGGPNQGVYNYSPSGIYFALPYIYNNAAGNNTVFASAFFCASAGTGC
jgi:hypothetical protein